VNTELDPMPIKALAPWFGGKRTLAPRIIRELGEHRAYWEPFAGGVSVILQKTITSFETINDLFGEIVNLARVVADESSAVELFARMNRTLMHETLFHEAAQRWRDRGITPAGTEPDVDRAADYMLCCWFGRNGVAGTSSYNQGFCVRYTKNGGHAAKRFQSAVESIPAWFDRLRNVTILDRDGIDLCERIEDAPGVVIYADPPYLAKGAKYIHDFDWLAHRRLAKALNKFTSTRVVVSYYEHRDLEAMYPPDRWTKVDCTMTKALVNQGMRDANGESAKAPEVLLINGPSFTAVKPPLLRRERRVGDE
jgi:DNA adenine methylase